MKGRWEANKHGIGNLVLEPTKKLNFSTKAKTLIGLIGVVRGARLLPMRVLSVSDWLSDPTMCLENIEEDLGSNNWIVRSSCMLEDQATSSMAGAFLSLPNIPTKGLSAAVARVIESYGVAQPTDEVLIQPMLENVIRSGVVFSHDPEACAPYRIVSWSDGRDTAVITSGQRGGRVWRQAANSPFDPPREILPIINLVEELEAIFGGKPLDSEFAVTSSDGVEDLWILQVRPLVLSYESESEKDQFDRLEQIEKKVVRGIKPNPFLVGKRTVYGVMPDWNPAEIIGLRPRPLSQSLYREMVTDSIWAFQRNNYGYRNLRSFPLMLHFFGLPYIDVRLSFNSFIPADLDEELAGRLVDYYVDCLLKNPSLHDKVEFEIVLSCYTFDIGRRISELRGSGFSEEDCGLLVDSLRRITNNVIHPESGLWIKDWEKIGILNRRYAVLRSSDVDNLQRIYWLIEDGKRYGTLPFAGLARAGFIAVQLLRSLVTEGVLSEQDHDRFMSSIYSIPRKLGEDRCLLDKATFLERYGHLRPGTYDILSDRYDENPDLYFDWNENSYPQHSVEEFKLSKSQLDKVDKLLRSARLECDVLGLFNFVKSGIELREAAKFDFTRNLSDVLSLIVKVGADHGLSRDDLSYCDISVIKELHLSALNPKKILSQSIEIGRLQYQNANRLSLPPLIIEPKDVWGFEFPVVQPNFIGRKRLTGQVVRPIDRDMLARNIVCIENADPGYDWLFAFPIGGLITAWGGSNSHMAIRAGELGIPAIIGAGEILFNRWSNAKRLSIDCAEKRVEVLE